MIETLMGLDVADNDGYQAYRDAMLPLLEIGRASCRERV